MNDPSEYQEQVALAGWLNKHIGEHGWFHVPNEGIREPRIGAKLKRAGLKKGVPDVVILVPPPGALPHVRGTVIEIKKRGGSNSSVTKEQSVWLKVFCEQDWLIGICFGAQEAVAWLKAIGYKERDDNDSAVVQRHG